MTLTRADHLREARDLFGTHAWSDACTHFEAVDEEEPLGGDDLGRLAVARYLVGRELDSVDTWTRTFHLARERDDLASAARSGFWVGFVLLNRGDLPGGNGWIARVRRMLTDVDAGVVEAGYVRYLIALRTIFEGDDEGARRFRGGGADRCRLRRP